MSSDQFDYSLPCSPPPNSSFGWTNHLLPFLDPGMYSLLEENSDLFSQG